MDLVLLTGQPLEKSVTWRCDKPIESLYAPPPEIECFRSHSPAHSVVHHVVRLICAGPPHSNRFHTSVHRVPSPGHTFAHPLVFPSTRSSCQYSIKFARICASSPVLARTRTHSLEFARIRLYSLVFTSIRSYSPASVHQPAPSSAVQTGSMTLPASTVPPSLSQPF